MRRHATLLLLGPLREAVKGAGVFGSLLPASRAAGEFGGLHSKVRTTNRVERSSARS